MHTITVADRLSSQLAQVHTQGQQNPGRQAAQKTKYAENVDRFIRTNAETVSTVQDGAFAEAGRAEIVHYKILLGAELTGKDLEFLKKTSPDLYDEYVTAENMRKQEEKAYQRALKFCATKEDVNRLKNTGINRCIAQADRIARKGNLSKEQKTIRLGAERRKIDDIYRNSGEYTRSRRYASLPPENDGKNRHRAAPRFGTLQYCAEVAAEKAKDRAEQRADEARNKSGERRVAWETSR